MILASFDIGRKNFAFCVERVDTAALDALDAQDRARIYATGEILLLEHADLTEGERMVSKTDVDPVVFVNMTKVLDRHLELFRACDTVLIEQQMNFGRQRNHVAVKLAQHCYSYFSFHFGMFKTIINYPAYRKTQLLGAPKKMDKRARKKWAVEEALRVVDAMGDGATRAAIESRKKRDDLADVIVQAQSFKVLRLQSASPKRKRGTHA